MVPERTNALFQPPQRLQLPRIHEDSCFQLRPSVAVLRREVVQEDGEDTLSALLLVAVLGGYGGEGVGEVG
jgi:hypothetical protein